LREVLQLAVEAEFSAAPGALQIGNEFRAEKPAEHFHGKEKPRAAGNPTCPAGSDATAGDDAMKVRMMMQILAPGVEHGH